MKRAQVFTLDLIVGLAIIASIISFAYYMSSQYLSSEQSSISNINAVSSIYSGFESFIDSNTTVKYFDMMQVSGISISPYINSHLSDIISYPFKLSLYAKENYLNSRLPNVSIFSYTSSNFNNQSSIYYLSSLILVYNSSKACVNCNNLIIAKSGFPDQNITINSAKCSIYSPSGVNVLSKGWIVYNETPTSTSCTVTIGNYSNALPTSYLVKAYNGTGSFIGNSTLHVLGLDTVSLSVDI